MHSYVEFIPSYAFVVICANPHIDLVAGHNARTNPETKTISLLIKFLGLLFVLKSSAELRDP